MRIANITEEGRWGGPQVRIANVAARLHDHDVDTLVIGPTLDSEQFQGRLSAAGVRSAMLALHRLTKELPILLRYITHFLPEIVHIKQELERHDIQVVHCNGSWQIKGMIAARLAGIPALWHLNDTYMPAPVKQVFSVVAPVLASGFICASHRTREYYLDRQALRDKPCRVIQAPVDTTKFDPKATQPDSAIAAYEGLKVVTVASINPVKGIEQFIDMAHLASQQFAGKVEFFVVGPIYDSQKSYGEQLKERARALGCDNLHFTGPSDNVAGVLEAADIYVCSSNFEASPISVWEAMAMAKPIVATDVGDVRYHFEAEDEPTGLVVPVGDAQAVADGVIELLDDELLRRRLGKRARRYAKAHLDLDICAQQHAEIYRQFAATGPTPGHDSRSSAASGEER